MSLDYATWERIWDILKEEINDGVHSTVMGKLEELLPEKTQSAIRANDGKRGAMDQAISNRVGMQLRGITRERHAYDAALKACRPLVGDQALSGDLTAQGVYETTLRALGYPANKLRGLTPSAAEALVRESGQHIAAKYRGTAADAARTSAKFPGLGRFLKVG